MAVIALLISAVILVSPFWFILPRVGIPSTVALVAVIPIGAVILLWIVAIREYQSGNGSRRF